MKAGQLLGAGASGGEAELNAEISSLSTDAASARQGALFFAVKGAQRDGTDFIDVATANGAIAVCENNYPARSNCLHVHDVRDALTWATKLFYDDPSARLKLAGITGTNGKTTTAYMLRSILQTAGLRCGLSSSVESAAVQTRPSRLTTPGIIELNALLAEMVSANFDAAVVETSSHALAQGRTAGLRFAVGVFTNLGRDHLDYHRTEREYLAAKLLLFAACDATAVNADDPNAPAIKGASRGETLSFSLRDPAAEVYARDIKGKSRLILNGKTFDVSLALPGTINLQNAAAAACAALALGVSEDVIAEGLCRFSGVPGRLQKIETVAPANFYIDFAHTPDALRGMLLALRPSTSGRLIVVFGCGGERDRQKRPLMGRVACELSDITIVTTCNPRREEPKTIIDDILTGIADRHGVEVIPDRRKAIEYAVEISEPGDSVVLAGKGHEAYQTFGRISIPFDEKTIVREAAARLCAKRQT